MTDPTDRFDRSQIGFQSLWAPRYHEPSFAYVVKPDENYPEEVRYIAAYVGGHSGLRINFDNPGDVEQLITALTDALAEFRAATPGPAETCDTTPRQEDNS